MAATKQIRGTGDGTCLLCKAPTIQTRLGYRKYCSEKCRSKHGRNLGLWGYAETKMKTRTELQVDNLLWWLENNPVKLQRLRKMLNNGATD